MILETVSIVFYVFHNSMTNELSDFWVYPAHYLRYIKSLFLFNLDKRRPKICSLAFRGYHNGVNSRVYE